MPQPNFPASAPAVPQPGPGQYADDPGFELDLVIKWLAQNQDTIAAKLGYSAATPADAPVSDRVLGSDANTKSKWLQITTAMVAADAVSQIAVDTGGGDTNTGVGGTLVDIASIQTTPTLTGGKGIALMHVITADTVDGAECSLGINIAGIGDVTLGQPSHAQQIANRRIEGLSIASFSGLSGATLFKGRFGRSGAAGTLTIQSGRLIVVEFKK